MKKIEKFGCYANKVIFNENTCASDNCKWIIPCKIMCGNKVDMFEYALIETLQGILERGEMTEVLIKNYNISPNAVKQAVKRWKKLKK